jgi:hypothetical protein
MTCIMCNPWKKTYLGALGSFDHDVTHLVHNNIVNLKYK